VSLNLYFIHYSKHIFAGLAVFASVTIYCNAYAGGLNSPIRRLLDSTTFSDMISDLSIAIVVNIFIAKIALFMVSIVFLISRKVSHHFSRRKAAVLMGKALRMIRRHELPLVFFLFLILFAGYFFDGIYTIHFLMITTLGPLATFFYGFILSFRVGHELNIKDISAILVSVWSPKRVVSDHRVFGFGVKYLALYLCLLAMSSGFLRFSTIMERSPVFVEIEGDVHSLILVMKTKKGVIFANQRNIQPWFGITMSLDAKFVSFGKLEIIRTTSD
jgi:hypothetical protein